MLHIILLAGGQSRRMHSQLPKVLHPLGGKPLLEHLIHTALALKPHTLSIVYGNEKVREKLKHISDIHWVFQTPSLGTGHAALQALPYLSDNAHVLILPGDTPLIQLNTLKAFLKETPSSTVGLATAIVKSPAGLGRIIRDTHQHILGIIEEKDATPLQQQICEINTGIYLITATLLKRWLPKLANHNAQAEYYLTDLIAMAVNESIPVAPFTISDEIEIQGVNTRRQLAELEKAYQSRQANQLLEEGLGLYDPHSFSLRGKLAFGEDSHIDQHVILEGDLQFGNHVYIGPFSVLRNVKLGHHVTIHSHCVIENAVIADYATIGPFARIRPGTQLQEYVQVGNFVEIKNSQIGAHTKIKHLSYIGDATLGKSVNIGAGTITCNYDGIQKHKTLIADEVWVGANTSLVAPIHLEYKATIGAGSTLTHYAPKNSLTLTRSKQITVKGWQRVKPSDEIK